MPTQQGNDPQTADARTWASQTPHLASGVAAGPTVIAAPDSTTSPLKIHGPGAIFSDNSFLEFAATCELILAGGSGNGYPRSELLVPGLDENAHREDSIGHNDRLRCCTPNQPMDN